MAINVERAIAVAARNSGVCAMNRAKTLYKPRVSAVSKQALPADLVCQGVPVDLAHLMLLPLPSSEGETAAGNQKKVGWSRGLL